MPSSLASQARDEIVELHAFFEGWFRGDLDADAFSRLEEALAEGFVMIGPDGEGRRRGPLLEGIRAGREAHPGIEIEIRNPRTVFEGGEHALLTYEEWQEGEDGPTGRISTALFRRDEGAPRGVVWVHLHETWLGQK